MSVSSGVFRAKQDKGRQQREYEVFFVPEASQTIKKQALPPPEQEETNSFAQPQHPRRQQLLQNMQQHNRQILAEPQQQRGQQQQQQNVPQHNKQHLAEPHVTKLGKNHKVRSWGCDPIKDAPFIYVHIGYVAGNKVRTRLSASTIRSQWTPNQDNLSHKFELAPNVPAAAVHSQFPNFRPSFLPTNPHKVADEWKTYEGTLPCAAETPIGQAIACPLTWRGKLAQEVCSHTHCNVLYAGHNLIGSEMHWLPSGVLTEWWEKTQHKNMRPEISQGLANRLTDWTGSSKSKCWLGKDDRTVTKSHAHYRNHYTTCVQPKSDYYDKLANPNKNITDWSFLYSSLPVQRVTVLREPMEWLVSKFFGQSQSPGYWTGSSGTIYRDWSTCDHGFVTKQNTVLDELQLRDLVDWISHSALEYMDYLCGEDCVVRRHHGKMTVEQMEHQARRNLQTSFSVVGLQEDLPTFYKMISARTAYLDTSLLPEWQGSLKESKPYGSATDTVERCMEVYTGRNEFVRRVTSMSPELAALRRLYRVGVQVYQTQLDELEKCGSLAS